MSKKSISPIIALTSFPLCRTFKIRRPQDAYDVPRYIGPEMYCHKMPCIQHQDFLTPFSNIPKLPREPFLCDRVKPKVQSAEDVLLV